MIDYIKSDHISII